MANFWDGPDAQSWQTLAAHVEEQTRYFWAIDSVSSAVDSALTTEELLAMALERSIQATGADSGSIYVLEGEDRWRMAASHNVPDWVQAERATIETDQRGLKLILEAAGPVTYSERLDEPSQYISPIGKRSGLQSWAAMPISALGVVPGVLTVTSREYGWFTSVHLELLRVIGQLIGLALSNQLAHALVLRQADSHLRHRVAELEAIFSSMSDGLIICDNQGSIIRANRAARELLGLPISEIVGQSVMERKWNIVPSNARVEYPEDDGPLLRAIRTGEECSDCPLEMTVRGRVRVFSITASPIRSASSELDGAVAVIRDITEQRQVEQMKEEFLGILSHEMRSPLTVISGYAQMLRRKLARQQMGDELSYVDLIKEHALRMSAMVGDLVESSRLESGVHALTKQPTNLGQVVEQVAARISAEHRYDKTPPNIEVSVEPGLPELEVDQRRIDQVITNLLSNAIRYSPERGLISVSVSRGCEAGAARRKARRTTKAQPLRNCVRVTDQGIGIPDDEKQLVFERAFRGQQANTVSVQGLGLGLYICKLAIDAHGGEIGVEDGPDGVGATFWFTLPS
jgi:two-component system phosphate regulon sensor histidine kinase PhoR